MIHIAAGPTYQQLPPTQKKKKRKQNVFVRITPAPEQSKAEHRMLCFVRLPLRREQTRAATVKAISSCRGRRRALASTPGARRPLVRRRRPPGRPAGRRGPAARWVPLRRRARTPWPARPCAPPSRLRRRTGCRSWGWCGSYRSRTRRRLPPRRRRPRCPWR